MRRPLKITGIVVLAVAVIVAAGFALGVLGVPAVSDVQNRFGPVNETNTVIYTDLAVSNPNPVGIRLGGVSVNYTVAMNGVEIARGQKDGLAIDSGNSTLNLTTAMANEQIPTWWYTHVRNGESTRVQIDATARSSTLGQSASFGRERSVETDIVGQFNATETRPVNANAPLVSDPVLYINETRGSWDRANLTRERMPLDLDFTVYNPKPVPYTVSKIGYDVTMNGIPVGSGETERGYLIEPGTTETVRANAAIRNENLDEWWVSHLERNQVTDLSIDFYLVVELRGEQIKIDPDSIDYEKRIETDIFGTKPASTASNDTDDRTETPTQTQTDDGGLVDESTDDGLLDDGTATDDGGLIDTATDDGGLIGTSSDTATDDGVLVGTATDDGVVGTETETGGSDTGTQTATETATATETDGGLVGGSTETTDDGIL